MRLGYLVQQIVSTSKNNKNFKLGDFEAGNQSELGMNWARTMFKAFAIHTHTHS